MESKYYEPDAEDFYVGMIYETEQDELRGIWEENAINTLRELEELCKYNSKYIGKYSNVRVKYLSKEDIESLGFKLKVENKYGITFANRLYSIVYSKMKSNHLEIFLIQPYVNEYDGLKFSGVIKNKSELRKLLIQLEIINE